MKTCQLLILCLALHPMVWACDCQDYGQIDCEKDEHCEPCTICIDRKCERNYEICWDGIDNDCDGNTDEWCEDSCGDVTCYPPPDRKCLDGDTLRYYLSPGECIDGICRYESIDYVCEDGCADDSCLEDPCLGLPCNDGDPCTVDNCSAETGCTNVPYVCADENPCTDDICLGDGTCNFVLGTAPCDDGDPCTMDDVCSQGLCSGAPLDEDGDGYVSSACGGPDCDDSYSTVYPGAAELCDGLDHNCDGLVDMVGTDMCNYEAFCKGTTLEQCPEGNGPTEAPRVIDEDIVWCARSSPYIHSGFSILAGKILVVGPCVEVRAEDGTSINVRGHLEVAGDEWWPAIFTSNAAEPQPGSWTGIDVQVNVHEEGSLSLSGAAVEFASEGLRIGDCHGCVVKVENSAFHNNEVGIAGYLGNNEILEVKNSIFLDNTCGSDRGKKLFEGCLFSGNEKGLCQAIGASLIDSTVTGNVVGIEGGNGTITNSLIAENTEYGILSSSANFALEGNTIVANGTGVFVVADNNGYIAPAHYNKICENREYDITMDTTQDFDATDNWWCSTDQGVISSRIHDVFDDQSLGQVLFEPFLEDEP